MTNRSERMPMVFVLILAAAASVASADTLMNHDPGVYKMTEFEDTGEQIPLNGPVIHVFSNDGKSYTSIANDNENLKHSSRVSGICARRTQDFSDAWIEVAGAKHDVSGTGSRSLKRRTETFEFPFTLPDISRTPVEACNHELDKRVAQGDRSRESWMTRGFVVKYQNAYEAKFGASCSGGILRGEFDTETIRTPVWIACAPTDVAEEPPPRAPKPKPKRKPKSRARPTPLKVKAELEATKRGTIYAPECPERVRYTGTIWVSRPGVDVKYQIVGSDWTSPERSVTLKKAGKHEITGWTQYYREKKADLGQLSTGRGDGKKVPDSEGSVRLIVTHEGGETESEPIPYKVFCNAEAPKLRIRSLDSDGSGRP